jgi:hypothetical protein
VGVICGEVGRESGLFAFWHKVVVKLCMAVTKEQFAQAITELNTALEEISTRIVNRGLSEADEDDLFAQTNAARDRARQIADQLNETPETPQA